MPATSKQQQKLMGIVRALQKGEVKPGSVSKQAQKMAKSMDPADVKKFAATKHKGLPKKVKKEGDASKMYLVRKPMEGMTAETLVMELNPLEGIQPLNIMQDDVLSVQTDETEAQRIAAEAYDKYCNEVQALEEKKGQTSDKIKKAIDKLEKKRKEHVDLAKEDPKNAAEHKEHIAKIAAQIDDLMSKMEKIEKSKKQIEKKEENKEKIHENVGNLNKAEKDIVNLILGDQIKEASINPNTILQRVKTLGAKGLLTLGIISTVLTSCGPSLEDWQKQEIKDQIEIQAKELEQKEKQADWDKEMQRLKSDFQKQGDKLDSLQSIK